jgi:hypothetical protein
MHEAERVTGECLSALAHTVILNCRSTQLPLGTLKHRFPSECVKYCALELERCTVSTLFLNTTAHARFSFSHAKRKNRFTFARWYRSGWWLEEESVRILEGEYSLNSLQNDNGVWKRRYCQRSFPIKSRSPWYSHRWPQSHTAHTISQSRSKTLRS